MSGIIEIKNGEIEPIDVRIIVLDEKTTYQKAGGYIFFLKQNIEKSYKLLKV